MSTCHRHPELGLLTSILGRDAADKLVSAPGGWRSLSRPELHALELSGREQRSIIALQRLTRRSYPKLDVGAFANAESVARVYGARLAGLEHEVVLAIAVDGRNHFLAELEVARGGLHGAALIPRDVFLPLIRAGASAFILVHNHPSGDPTPSQEDVAMTRTLVATSVMVGILLLDHVVVAARGGGWTSLLDLGLIEPSKETQLEQVAE